MSAARTGGAILIGAALTVATAPVSAHPHVFVDGGVDFVLRDGTVLEALEVTWLYDPFETLYILASLEITPDAEWQLEDADRERLIAKESNWAEDFSGAAHLSVDGEDVALSRPRSLDVRLVEDRLQVTFRRDLASPIDVAGRDTGVAFYEATYFYAFKVTNAPRIIGGDANCSATVLPFKPDAALVELQAILYGLGREEAPEIENVGELFADWIFLSCA